MSEAVYADAPCPKCGGRVATTGQTGHCEACDTDLMIAERFSRIVGYYAPLSRWNKAKLVEFRDRRTYVLQRLEEDDHAAQAD